MCMHYICVLRSWYSLLHLSEH